MSTAPGPYPAAPPPPRRPPGDPQWLAPGASGTSSARQDASGGESPWATTRRPSGERVTSRVRQVVEGLPDWEPLPPGETVVRRPGGTG
ncbi:hypothetical protein ACF09J_11730 [Streptomyces sp. NPDC014889]|uniref:hypothetical protein n=1 Tax=Streptomyces sp. NPDC014889 TaxID=3364928 RepID=UPI0037004C9B